MTKQFLSFALVASLLQALVIPVSAESQTGQTEKVKATVASSRAERAVTIEMRDGTKVKGYIREHLEESFTLIDTKTLQATTIAYGDVAKVDKGLPRFAKVLLWTGAVYGILAAIGVAMLAAGAA